MRSILLFAFAFFACSHKASTADSRVITENGTNILAVGIDSRDFEVVRFYLRGTNVLEFRADDILHTDRKVFGADLQPALSAERAAILQTLRNNTNFTAAQAPTILSNMLRVQIIDEIQRSTRNRSGP